MICPFLRDEIVQQGKAMLMSGILLEGLLVCSVLTSCTPWDLNGLGCCALQIDV